jgi:hypothetical protein
MKIHRTLAMSSLVALIGLTTVACGGDDDSSTATSAPPTTIASTSTATPAPASTESAASTEPAGSGDGAIEEPSLVFPGVLDIGTWVTNRFGNEFTFETDVPWTAFETRDSFVLTEVVPSGSEEITGEVALLATARDLTVDEVVANLQAAEGLTFSEPEPASVMGLDGVVLTAPNSAEEVVFEWLFDTTIEQPWVAIADTRHEVYVVSDGENTLLVWIDGPDATWETVRSSAQYVLDSIQWSTVN